MVRPKRHLAFLCPLSRVMSFVLLRQSAAQHNHNEAEPQQQQHNNATNSKQQWSRRQHNKQATNHKPQRPTNNRTNNNNNTRITVHDINALSHTHQRQILCITTFPQAAGFRFSIFRRIFLRIMASHCGLIAVRPAASRAD